MAGVGTLYRQDSNIWPGYKGVQAHHIIRTGSFPEDAFHSDSPKVAATGFRHRLANAYVDSPKYSELQLIQGNKLSQQQPMRHSQPQQLPQGFAGARCNVRVSSPAAQRQLPGFNGDACGSPTKQQRIAPAGSLGIPTPGASQRAAFEAARDQILAENEAAPLSPLSPGNTGASRRLASLFGLFREESLGRTNTEGPDVLLAQVAAEAESGELDDLGDPAELHDLCSTDTDFEVPPLSCPLPAMSSAMAADMGRAATIPPPIQTTQIVLAPRAASMPETPRLPEHLTNGPPSPHRRPSVARSSGTLHAGSSHLEVAGGGITKRRGSSGDLRSASRAASMHLMEEDSLSQRSGSVGPGRSVDDDVAMPQAVPPPPKLKAKRAQTGDRRPRRMTCNYCKTHVTPQWRCGPDGPRTLCNACGVRWGKGKLEVPGHQLHPRAPSAEAEHTC